MTLGGSGTPYRFDRIGESGDLRDIRESIWAQTVGLGLRCIAVLSVIAGRRLRETQIGPRINRTGEGGDGREMLSCRVRPGCIIPCVWSLRVSLANVRGASW